MTNPTTEQLEARISAAFDARASQVTADGLSAHALPQRRPVGRRAAFVACATAAAALVVVSTAVSGVRPWQDKKAPASDASPVEAPSGVRELGGGKWDAFGVSIQLPEGWRLIDARAATGHREACVVSAPAMSSCLMRLLVAAEPARSLSEGVDVFKEIDGWCERPGEMVLRVNHAQVNGRAASQYLGRCAADSPQNTAWTLDNRTVALVAGGASADAGTIFRSITTPTSWPTEPPPVPSAEPVPYSPTALPSSATPTAASAAEVSAAGLAQQLGCTPAEPFEIAYEAGEAIPLAAFPCQLKGSVSIRIYRSAAEVQRALTVFGCGYRAAGQDWVVVVDVLEDARTAATKLGGRYVELPGCKTNRSSEAAAPKATPSPQETCEGLPASAQAIGVAGPSQEQYAESFASVVLGAKAHTVERVDACAIVLEPSGTRLHFSRARKGGWDVTHASSFDDPDATLGLSVIGGEVTADSGDTCKGCVRIEARILAEQGASAPRTFAIGKTINFSTPATWTKRALLLRFLGADSGVRGVLLVSFDDGDFSAS